MMPEINVDIYIVVDMKTAKESTKDMQPTVKEYKPKICSNGELEPCNCAMH